MRETPSFVNVANVCFGTFIIQHYRIQGVFLLCKITNLLIYSCKKKVALQEKNILNHADLYLDYNNRIAFHKNRKINLTVKEFDILFFLASYPGQVFTHRQIYETVWGKKYFCDEGNVTAHIGHIRKKIELDPRNPVFYPNRARDRV